MENRSLIYVVIAIGIICILLGAFLVLKPNTPPNQVPNTPVPAGSTSVASSTSKTIRVSSTSPWTPTGIDTTGKTVTIRRVSGMWNSVDDNNDQAGEGVGYYPGTTFPQAKIGELIAKTDDGMHRVGTSSTIQSRGLLYLGMNDVPGKYADNHGELVVEITVK